MLPLELDRNEVSRSHSELNHNEVSRWHLTHVTNDQTDAQTAKINYDNLHIPFISIVFNLLYTCTLQCMTTDGQYLPNCCHVSPSRQTWSKDIIGNRSYAKVEMYFEM